MLNYRGARDVVFDVRVMRCGCLFPQATCTSIIVVFGRVHAASIAIRITDFRRARHTPPYTPRVGAPYLSLQSPPTPFAALLAPHSCTSCAADSSPLALLFAHIFSGSDSPALRAAQSSGRRVDSSLPPCRSPCLGGCQLRRALVRRGGGHCQEGLCRARGCQRDHLSRSPPPLAASSPAPYGQGAHCHASTPLARPRRSERSSHACSPSLVDTRERKSARI